MRTNKPSNEPGHALSVTLILVVVGLFLAALAAGMSTARPTPPGMGPVFMGLSLVALGLSFGASYFFAHKAYFLRWLLSFSVGFPSLRDSRMALFFCVLFVASGIAAIAKGLGFTW